MTKIVNEVVNENINYDDKESEILKELKIKFGEVIPIESVGNDSREEENPKSPDDSP